MRQFPPRLRELPQPHCPMLFSADICVPETRPSWALTLPLAGIHMSFSTVMTQQQLEHFHADLYIGELTFQF